MTTRFVCSQRRTLRKIFGWDVASDAAGGGATAVRRASDGDLPVRFPRGNQEGGRNNQKVVKYQKLWYFLPLFQLSETCQITSEIRRIRSHTGPLRCSRVALPGAGTVGAQFKKHGRDSQQQPTGRYAPGGAGFLEAHQSFLNPSMLPLKPCEGGTLRECARRRRRVRIKSRVTGHEIKMAARIPPVIPLSQYH